MGKRRVCDLAMIVVQVIALGSNILLFPQSFATDDTNGSSTDDASKNMIQVAAKTDKTVYQFQEPIDIEIKAYNSSNETITLTDEDMNRPFLGFEYACGKEAYFDFLVIEGDHYPAIEEYGDIVGLEEKALNVRNPADFYRTSCFYPYVENVKSVVIEPNSHNATVTYSERSTNESHSVDMDLKKEYIIWQIYDTGITGDEALRQQEDNSTSEPISIPVGKYTIVAFTLSGQLSKPLVIEIVPADALGLSNSSLPPIIGIGAAIAGIIAFLTMRKKKQ